MSSFSRSTLLQVNQYGFGANAPEKWDIFMLRFSSPWSHPSMVTWSASYFSSHIFAESEKRKIEVETAGRRVSDSTVRWSPSSTMFPWLVTFEATLNNRSDSSKVLFFFSYKLHHITFRLHRFREHIDGLFWLFLVDRWSLFIFKEKTKRQNRLCANKRQQ